MVERRQHVDAGTPSQILDVAERLAQVRGFNGFSYADVAAELHITKAALHYHFASKAELGEALMERYAQRFGEALAAVDTNVSAAPAKLDAYAALYLDVLRNQRMCLCGMLAAEYQTLPAPMQGAVIRFLDDNEAWLAGVLEQGRRDGSLSFSGPAREHAQMVLSSLEGAMLLARSYGEVGRFEAAAARVLAGLTATAAASRSAAAGPRSTPAAARPAPVARRTARPKRSGAA
jgi:TetR/AcrR family transcriptional regulator, transcriptional repressor for nem operon